MKNFRKLYLGKDQAKEFYQAGKAVYFGSGIKADDETKFSVEAGDFYYILEPVL